MKYAILFILLLGIVAKACKDEMFTGQTPVDGVAPLQIKNPEVINVEGGALITYDLPDEEDLLYVEAKYKRRSGDCTGVGVYRYAQNRRVGRYYPA